MSLLYRALLGVGVCVCVLFGASHVTNADAITWNFTGSGGIGSDGNALSFTSGGVKVSATAWSYNGSFQNARLGQWGTGLGVCADLEGYCNTPDHQVDNAGTDDYVLFLFSAQVDPSTVRIDPYGTWDRDVSYWVGNVDSSLDSQGNLRLNSLAGTMYGGLTGLRFTSNDPFNSNGTTSGAFRDVSIYGSTSVNALLFGAQRGSESSDPYYTDRFKITGMTATASVPEPSSMLLLALGMGVIGLVSMRRNLVKG